MITQKMHSGYLQGDGALSPQTQWQGDKSSEATHILVHAINFTVKGITMNFIGIHPINKDKKIKILRC